MKIKEGSVDNNIIKQAFEMILNKTTYLTFNEIEKSCILVNMCSYIDQSFLINLEKNVENYEIYTNTPGADFLNRTKMIYNILLSSWNIKDFISVLQYSISSINCFKLNISNNDTKFHGSNLNSNCKIDV